jgi:hypothetical protein
MALRAVDEAEDIDAARHGLDGHEQPRDSLALPNEGNRC